MCDSGALLFDGVKMLGSGAIGAFLAHWFAKKRDKASQDRELLLTRYETQLEAYKEYRRIVDVFTHQRIREFDKADLRGRLRFAFGSEKFADGAVFAMSNLLSDNTGRSMDEHRDYSVAKNACQRAMEMSLERLEKNFAVPGPDIENLHQQATVEEEARYPGSKRPS